MVLRHKHNLSVHHVVREKTSYILFNNKSGDAFTIGPRTKYGSDQKEYDSTEQTEPGNNILE